MSASLAGGQTLQSGAKARRAQKRFVTHAVYDGRREPSVPKTHLVHHPTGGKQMALVTILEALGNQAADRGR